MMTSDRYPIRTIFRKFYPEYLESTSYVSHEAQRAAECIMKCKTGELGYTVDVCEECGYPKIYAVSCNNKACPCCQAPLAKKWELERNTELIENISYYHVVFTVPHELNLLIQANEKLLLDLLFRCVTETLLNLCADKKYMGAKPGIISVLHTWGSNLSFHPHIHTCISGGGITVDNRFVETSHRGFFLPEAVIASSFRGRYLCTLKSYYADGKLDLSQTTDLEDPEKWKAFINALFKKRWLPFVKETFNGRGNAVSYLARYSYRTAISNSRIRGYDDSTVTFEYKDYRDGGKTKTMTVSGMEFIRRFLKHVQPSHFNRIRYSGYLTNCRKTFCLKLIHMLRSTVYPGNPYRTMNNAQLMMALYHKDVCKCGKCGGKTIVLCRGKPQSGLLLYSELLEKFEQSSAE